MTSSNIYKDNFMSQYLADTSKLPPDLVIPLLFMDSNYVPGSFYAESVIYLRASDGSPSVHTHEDHDEILMFFGTNMARPGDLCGEIEVWIGGEKHVVTETTMLFVPKGVTHCPMYCRRADRPILTVSTMPARHYSRDEVASNPTEPLGAAGTASAGQDANHGGARTMSSSDTYKDRFVSQYLADTSPFSPDVVTPLVFMDSSYVPGAFYAESVIYLKAGDGTPPVHKHEEYDEILMFFGTDMENPHDLCGEVELWIGGEKYSITESTMVLVPKGVEHCPMYCRRADRPIITVTTLAAKYYQDAITFKNPADAPAPNPSRG